VGEIIRPVDQQEQENKKADEKSNKELKSLFVVKR
jgi:hypothetical protein